MLIDKGQKIHVIARRTFDGDIRRHFVGEVLEASENSVLVEGYVFVFAVGINEYIKKSGIRKRIFSLVDAGNIINIIPGDVNIDEIVYRNDLDKLFVTDNKNFELDIHEFGSQR